MDVGELGPVNVCCGAYPGHRDDCPEGPSEPAPTPTALAAKAFMERIDNRSFMQTIESRALNGGWVGSREAGCWDTHVCDSIAKAAVGAVLDLFRQWAAECDEHPLPGAPA